jgi:predicted dehydrogenase/threonine dehydrogenase-like Zn-dependent dehydrogenase
MKQIIQDLTHGKTSIINSPAPQNSVGQVLINTTISLISAGTERMLVDFGKASYLDKARQQPEKVKMVLEKIKTDGLFSTVNAVRSKLSQPLPLGYCNVGVVAELGFGVQGFSVGDRVVSNAPHGDIVNSSANLCARIPENVSDEAAVFTVLASIALQGIRLAAPTLGEAVVVTGVGLIGLLTVQILKAHGCRVLALDFNADHLALAQQFGAEICNLSHEDPVAAGMIFSRGRGVDAVIITASTKSNDPVHQAAQMSRKRGRIVLVGVTGLELNRADFYEKELSFQVSCSYGPGRYDLAYEKEGHDYPYGFVRWTAQRNFEACLDLMAEKQLQLEPLITHRYLFEDATKAYEALTDDAKVLGIILQYTSEPATRHVTQVSLNSQEGVDPLKPMLGFIGAGNYAARILIPAFKKAGAQFHTIVTSGGLSGVINGKKSGFLTASTDVDAMLRESMINTVVIATRHDTHAHFVVKALSAGKHVFVEKPLALNLDQLSSIEASYHTAIMTGKKPCLMVGFNRRFAPTVQKMKQLLATVHEPQSFIMTINAGKIPLDHWTQDQMVGGGRIIGEACHFIDLMRYLAGCDIVSVHACGMNDVLAPMDKATITLSFANGSFGTIHYLSNGAASFPKERIEVFTAGRILQLDNFRRLYGFGWPRFKKMTLWRQDKGQTACAKAFLEAIENGETSPITASEIFEVARISMKVDELLRQPVSV